MRVERICTGIRISARSVKLIAWLGGMNPPILANGIADSFFSASDLQVMSGQGVHHHRHMAAKATRSTYERPH